MDTIVKNVMQRVTQIKLSVFRVVRNFDFEMLTEIEVDAFNDKHFEHGGQ